MLNSAKIKLKPNWLEVSMEGVRCVSDAAELQWYAELEQDGIMSLATSELGRLRALFYDPEKVYPTDRTPWKPNYDAFDVLYAKYDKHQGNKKCDCGRRMTKCTKCSITQVSLLQPTRVVHLTLCVSHVSRRA